MRYAEVAVDAPTAAGRTFTYSIPHHLHIAPGHLVRVPFGRRRLHGIVFSLAETSPVEETRDIQGLVEEAPLLSPVHLEVARWVSAYYRAPLFAAVAPALPPGFRTQARPVFWLKQGTPQDTRTPLERRAIAFLRGQRGPVEESHLARVLGRAGLRAASSLARRDVAERGWRWAEPTVRPRLVRYLCLSAKGDVASAAHTLGPRAHRQAQLLWALAEVGDGGILLAQAKRDYGESAVSGLRAKGLAVTANRRQERDPLAGQRVARDVPPMPTPEQAEALSAIHAALDDPTTQPRVFLLYGVTGSGKTEVYLQALAHCIHRGKRALVLVPEIALTPQTVYRFRARFPGRVAILHSGLSPGEQFDQWWRVAQGDFDVVIGSRSAVFAPQPDLGLVVLDEEHEWTYKQEDTVPRYHARDVALRLSQLTGAVVVLGSATPQLESFYMARRGVYGLLGLPRRMGEWSGSGALASVDVVDMRRELREGNRSIFSRALQDALRDCLNSGGRAILFLNRRGAASVVQCRDCGQAVRCSRCDLPLTLHDPPGVVVCHLCNRRRRPPQICPACESPRVRYLGLGTQRVAQEVAQLCPGAGVMRWDRDVAANRRAHEALLERFVSGHADVLVGTQMVAKGLHLPSVTLVGAVLADIGLNVPDLRAAERTFQVLCQVAGRAGRGPGGGRVIVQTYRPHHYAVEAAARQDYAAFYQQELTFRRQLGAPPFGRLVHLVCTATSVQTCQREASRVAAALRHQARAWGLDDIHIVGPAPAYPERIRGRYRWHIVLRGREPHVLLDKVAVPAGWTVDVDPISVA